MLDIEFVDEQPFVFEFKQVGIDNGDFENVRLNLETPKISDADLDDRANELKELIEG